MTDILTKTMDEIVAILNKNKIRGDVYLYDHPINEAEFLHYHANTNGHNAVWTTTRFKNVQPVLDAGSSPS